ncbi:MAG TPA: methyltransferase [Longimicrobium sp.]|nr:methyltransferase [Longimicrobium sp.]
MPLLLKPNEHQALFETHDAPAPMLDILGAAALRMAATASRLGIFASLAERSLTAAEVATRAGTDPRGTALLLDALHSHGYLRRETNGGHPHYANSQTATRWMAQKPGFADTVEFWDALLFTLWPTLEQSLREGRPPTDWYAWLEGNPSTLRAFHSMLGAMARNAGPLIAEAAALPDSARRLLDVGGSHALYSAAFCRARPRLTATVVDFPGALAIGRENVAAEGMEDRIRLRPCNFLQEPLGGGYDAVLLCRVVHGLDAEANLALLRKAHDALAPGGRVVVVEEYDPERRAEGAVSDAFMRTFSLNMYHLVGAQNYPTHEITAWLAAAGFDPATIREVPAGADRVIGAARPGGER